MVLLSGGGVGFGRKGIRKLFGVAERSMESLRVGEMTAPGEGVDGSGSVLVLRKDCRLMRLVALSF